jgi:hypothetical protein
VPEPSWSTDDPTLPGIYWVVLHEHDRDVAEHDIYEMAHGWRMDPRPYPAVAEICRDDEDPDTVVPFFVGTDEYPFDDLHHDYKEVWWYGPLELPPPPPGHLPLRPLGECGLRPFSVPGTWPPELETT